MLLKRNGYVLEQLYSPLLVAAMREHEELKAIARGCITRHHVHHYLGLADTQWRLFQKEHPPRVKPLLHTYRVLLTGIHMMRTGRVEANLAQLNAERRLPYVAELIERKISGCEQEVLSEEERDRHAGQIGALQWDLKEAGRRSRLPDEAQSLEALNDLLVRLRLAAF